MCAFFSMRFCVFFLRNFAIVFCYPTQNHYRKEIGSRSLFCFVTQKIKIKKKNIKMNSWMIILGMNVWFIKIIMSYPNCNNKAMLDIEIEALIDFYKASDNTEYWIHKWDYNSLCNNVSINNNNNNNNNHTYIPHGISINTNNSLIYEIYLYSNNISGILTHTLGNLHSLVKFYVANNSLTGIKLNYSILVLVL